MIVEGNLHTTIPRYLAYWHVILTWHLNLHTTVHRSIYIYDTCTPPGIVLNVIRLLFAFLLVMVFADGAIKAHAGANKRAHDVQSSLMIFVFLMASWLLVAPFMAMIDTYVDPVAREKTAVSFDCIGHAYGASILLLILWPGRTREYFSVSGTALSAAKGWEIRRTSKQESEETRGLRLPPGSWEAGACLVYRPWWQHRWQLGGRALRL